MAAMSPLLSPAERAAVAAITDALGVAARGYLEARKAHQDALAAARAAEQALYDAEILLIEEISSTGDEDSGSTVVVNGLVISVIEEWWDLPKGQQLRVERLLAVL